MPAIVGRELLLPGCAKAVMYNQYAHGDALHAALAHPILSPEPEPQEHGSMIHVQVMWEPPADWEEGDSAPEGYPLEQEGLHMATKRTYQPSTIVRKRRHGFLSRIRTVGGRRVVSRRKAKGRRKLTA